MTLQAGSGEYAPAHPFRAPQTDMVRFWVIASITVSIIGITYVSMARGYGAIVPQLFYFPILYTTYFYPDRSLYVGGTCAGAYLLIAAPFVAPDPFIVGGVIFQALLFLGIAAGSGYVMQHRGLQWSAPPKDESQAVEAMIREGENDRVEFKRRSLWSADLTKEEIAASDSAEIRKYRNNASKFIVARAIAGFLNTGGGDLFIGIDEDRLNCRISISGIEDDYLQLHEADRNPDGYRRMIIDSVIRKYLPEVFDTVSMLFHISFPVVSKKTLCRIHILPADRPVFVSTGSEEIFFIRTDASTRPVSGKTMTHYILKRFGKA